MNKDNNNDNNKKNTPPKRQSVYYYSIALILLLLLNAFVFPLLTQQSVEEVTYNQFMEWLDNGQIDAVEIGTSEISFTLTDSTDDTTYVTGVMDDPNLVDKLEAAGVEYSSEIPTETTPLTSFLINWVFPILLFIIVWQVFMNYMQKRMGTGGGMFSLGKSNAKLYVAEKTKKTFADVAGQDEAKEALTELVDFLNHPEKYKQIGAKLPKGALLVGPPGTGKTLLAQAIAGEAGVPFFSISGSEFVEMFVGMGAARVRDLFKQAQEKAPCIVFIDEIDAIGKHRDGVGLGGNDEREQTLNQLLAEMDGFDSSSGVVILAATNRPESLDKALLRPGRFDRRIPVDLPDLRGREAILKVHSKDIIVASDIDYKAVARATSGASGADLANIVNEAALLAVKGKRAVVIQEDFEEAVENVIAGYQRKGAVITSEEKEIIAYHEVGHAIVAAKMKYAAPVHKITIIPRTSGALGFTMQLEEQERVLMSKNAALDRITTLLGGRAAEDVIFNTITQDTSFGCSSETSSKVDTEVLRIINECPARALQILKENSEKHHEIAKYLLTKETMSGEEFMQMMGKNTDDAEWHLPEGTDHTAEENKE
jgi:cell division protease FtsH